MGSLRRRWGDGWGSKYRLILAARSPHATKNRCIAPAAHEGTNHRVTEDTENSGKYSSGRAAPRWPRVNRMALRLGFVFSAFSVARWLEMKAKRAKNAYTSQTLNLMPAVGAHQMRHPQRLVDQFQQHMMVERLCGVSRSRRLRANRRMMSGICAPDRNMKGTSPRPSCFLRRWQSSRPLTRSD